MSSKILRRLPGIHVKRAKPGERSVYDDAGEYQNATESWNDPDNPAVIKLDKDGKDFNVWRERVKDDREPGLINLQRYALSLPNHGIKTFLARQVALTPGDLKAVKVDVAIFGARSTGGSTRDRSVTCIELGSIV